MEPLEDILNPAESREPAGQRLEGSLRFPKAVLWHMDDSRGARASFQVL